MILTTSQFLLTLTATASLIFAYTSELNEEREIYYTEGNDFSTVKINSETKLNSDEFYYEPGNEIYYIYGNWSDQESQFDYILNSLKVTGSGKTIKNYTTEINDNILEVTIPRSQTITRFNPFRSIIEYKTDSQVKTIGNIVQIPVVGFEEGTELEFYDASSGTSSKSNFSTTIYYTGSNSVSTYHPESIEIKKTDEGYIVTYHEEDLLKGGGFVIFGDKQYYYFKITQEAPKTDTMTPAGLGKFSDKISSNFYTINLPREFAETNQQVYYKNIAPAPTRIFRDPDGNLSAKFETPATRNTEIVIEGYITLDYQAKDIPDITLTEYYEQVDSNFDKYLSSGLYWEVDHPEIQKIANDLKTGKNTLLELIRADYNYLVEKYEYSDLKAVTENIRQGALSSLQGSEAVCMEYADSMIAILRAQGVPARAAIGYSNDPNELDLSIEEVLSETQQSKNLDQEGSDNTDLSEDLNTNNALELNGQYDEISETNMPITHQWLQVWVPDYGWLSVDPTWGESGVEYIGPDLEHALWFTYDDYFNIPSATSAFSGDFIINPEANVGNYNIEVSPVSEEKFLEDEMSLKNEQGYYKELQSFVEKPIEQLNENGENSNTDSKIAKKEKLLESLNIALRGTCIGRSIILFSPVCLVLAASIGSLAIFAGLRRRKKRSSVKSFKSETTRDNLPSYPPSQKR